MFHQFINKRLCYVVSINNQTIYGYDVFTIQLRFPYLIYSDYYDFPCATYSQQLYMRLSICCFKVYTVSTFFKLQTTSWLNCLCRRGLVSNGLHRFLLVFPTSSDLSESFLILEKSKKYYSFIFLGVARFFFFFFIKFEIVIRLFRRTIIVMRKETSNISYFRHSAPPYSFYLSGYFQYQRRFTRKA